MGSGWLLIAMFIIAIHSGICASKTGGAGG